MGKRLKAAERDPRQRGDMEEDGEERAGEQPREKGRKERGERRHGGRREGEKTAKRHATDTSCHLSSSSQGPLTAA